VRTDVTNGTDDGDLDVSPTLRRPRLAGVTELRRRNRRAVAVDLIYLFTTAFFATLTIRGVRPAIIAAPPLLAFLYLARRSSWRFFVTNLLVVALSLLATAAGLQPL
jgi:hypothetical protein